MAGRAGTPRFGDYVTDITGAPGSDGQNQVHNQSGDTFTEQHSLFNPSQQSRSMGTTLGEAPGAYYDRVPRVYNAMANHDGFMAGQDHINQLDERKVLEETVYSVPVVCADDWFDNSGSDERTA